MILPPLLVPEYCSDFIKKSMASLDLNDSTVFAGVFITCYRISFELSNFDY